MKTIYGVLVSDEVEALEVKKTMKEREKEYLKALGLLEEEAPKEDTPKGNDTNEEHLQKVEEEKPQEAEEEKVQPEEERKTTRRRR